MKSKKEAVALCEQSYSVVTRDTAGTFLTLSSKTTKKKAAAFRIKSGYILGFTDSGVGKTEMDDMVAAMKAALVRLKR